MNIEENLKKYRKFTGQSEIHEWLRIGERGSSIILNYKNWYDIYCDEYEVEIDNAENTKKIFNVLGIKELIKVEKQQRPIINY